MGRFLVREKELLLTENSSNGISVGASCALIDARGDAIAALEFLAEVIFVTETEGVGDVGQ